MKMSATGAFIFGPPIMLVLRPYAPKMATGKCNIMLPLYSWPLCQMAIGLDTPYF